MWCHMQGTRSKIKIKICWLFPDVWKIFPDCHYEPDTLIQDAEQMKYATAGFFNRGVISVSVWWTLQIKRQLKLNKLNNFITGL